MLWIVMWNEMLVSSDSVFSLLVLLVVTGPRYRSESVKCLLCKHVAACTYLGHVFFFCCVGSSPVNNDCELWFLISCFILRVFYIPVRARWGFQLSDCPTKQQWSSLILRLTTVSSFFFFCRFCDLVNSITEETWKGPEEGECDADALEVRRPVQLRGCVVILLNL